MKKMKRLFYKGGSLFSSFSYWSPSFTLKKEKKGRKRKTGTEFIFT